MPNPFSTAPAMGDLPITASTVQHEVISESVPELLEEELLIVCVRGVEGVEWSFYERAERPVISATRTPNRIIRCGTGSAALNAVGINSRSLASACW